MLRVIRNHRRAAYNVAAASTRASRSAPCGIDRRPAPPTCSRRRPQGLGRALALGEKHGYRNAQVTVIAPTGTIGLVMDCDTTGIEPDFALVKFKKLAGGGYFKIINQSVPPALREARLHRHADRRHRALRVGRGTLVGGARAINHDALKRQGLHRRGPPAGRGAARRRVRHQVRVQPLRPRRRVLPRRPRPHRRPARRPGASTCSRPSASARRDPAANDYVCGTMTVEGAPHLKPSTCRCSTAPTVRPLRQALHRPEATSA
jgi:ribonucleoside-diphosphate reductase alpha chain